MEDFEYLEDDKDFEEWKDNNPEEFFNVYVKESIKNNLKNLEDKSESERNYREELEILKAIVHEYNAANAISQGHPDRAVYLYNLGCNLEKLYEKRGHTSDIDEAIRIGQAAIDSMPENHPDRVQY